MNEGITKLSELNVETLAESLHLVPRKQGQRKKKGEPEIFDVITAFDIETSKITLPDKTGDAAIHSFMYIWQFQFGLEYTITGRTWEEFTELKNILKKVSARFAEKNKLKTRPLFICYVHNLAYEFMYLTGIYEFQNENCFFRDVRKPLYARLDNIIEFRCSYLHSNMSLKKWAENVGCQTRKLDGRRFDYEKIRYPWTELTDYELQYCVNDVRIITEALTIELERDGDTLKTIPLTNTGYVRRDVKEALKPLRYSIECMLPDRAVYDLLCRAFRGGDTHANRYRTSEIQHNGHSLDIESSYPAVLLEEKFPMGPFHRLENEDTELLRIQKLIEKGNAVIADYTFKGLRLRDSKSPIPYIPLAKSHCVNAYVDNGRVISADRCQIALTEIDLAIIEREYEYHSVKVSNAYTAIKAPLPRAFRDVVMKYYTQKTKLKGVAGSEYEYQKMKNKLNSTFGMCVQKPVHEIIYYNTETDEWRVLTPDEEGAENDLEKAAFPYQWGVYCTAYARFRLRQGMYCVPKDENGYSNIVYCDTDSIKYIGDADFTALNRELTALAKKAGGTAKNDITGEQHYIGVYTQEPDWKDFITHGAKRYAYRDMNDKIHITISGVEQTKHIYYSDDVIPDMYKSQIKTEIIDGETVNTIPYCVEELIAADPHRDALENFRQGMIWHEAGGNDVIYHPNGMAEETEDFTPFPYTDPETGKSVMVTKSATICDTTYTLGYDEDYRNVVDDCIYWIKYLRETGRVVK